MEGNIPVPAESLRTLAQNAHENARRQKAEGRSAISQNIETAIGEVMTSLEGKDGEFVSISPRTASTLAAFSDLSESDVLRHSDAAEVFLKQYGHW